MRGFGELEAVIMDRLWSLGRAATVRELLTDLSQRRVLAYTTVLTVVDNLWKKEWLRREPDGRAYRYAPVLTREQYGAQVMRAALDGTGDRAAALTHFVGRMSAEEAAALRGVLERYEQGGPDS
jgi:predicted transcriptional regulator